MPLSNHSTNTLPQLQYTSSQVRYTHTSGWVEVAMLPSVTQSDQHKDAYSSKYANYLPTT
jgi:hypothetical protein